MRWFVVAIVVALQFVAHADPSEDAALAHLDRGIAAFNAKDFSRALGEFTAAHDLVPDKANPYRWLALTEIQLGDCMSALPHIDAFLSRVPATDARTAEMTRWREFCRREPGPGQPPSEAPQVTGTQGLAATPPPASKPLHERWWFWPAIGTAVVAVTGAIVYAATTSGDAMLPPIQCGNAGCK